MRTLTLIILVTLLFTSNLAFGQSYAKPEYYLDGKRIDIEKVHINPKMIESIIVKKDINDGVLIITSKSKSMKFFTLNHILKNYTNIGNQQRDILFKIKEKYITDTTGVLIDQSFFIYANSTDFDKNGYLGHKLENLTIIEIALEEKERKQSVIIKGKK